MNPTKNRGGELRCSGRVSSSCSTSSICRVTLVTNPVEIDFNVINNIQIICVNKDSRLFFYLQISTCRHIFGITFIRYAQNQKIEKPNNLKLCEQKGPKSYVK